VNAIVTAWVVVSSTCLSLLGRRSARYVWVTFCYHGLETMTYPSSVVAVISSRAESVVHGAAAVIWNDSRMAIGGVFGVVFVSDLKRVSVDCDEVVEKRSDCLKASDGAHETCHDVLLGRDFYHRYHLGRRCRVRDVAAEIVVACIGQHALFSGVPGRRTVETANLVVVVHDRNLYLGLGRLLCGHRHESDHRVHVQGVLHVQDAQSVRGDLGARCGGTNRSCRSALDPREDVARPQLWTSVCKVRYANGCKTLCPHLFFLQFELLRLQQLPRYADGTFLCTQHEVPQLFTEHWRILVQKARELDLDLLDFGLLHVSSNL